MPQSAIRDVCGKTRFAPSIGFHQERGANLAGAFVIAGAMVERRFGNELRVHVPWPGGSGGAADTRRRDVDGAGST